MGKRKYAVACQWHSSCNLDLPSRNNNPFGRKGLIYQFFDTYKEAKKTQKEWVREELNSAFILPDLRQDSIDCGDCTISVEIATPYIVQDKETGTFIDAFETEKKAKAQILKFEEKDKKEGNFTPEFYEVVIL